jgi:hypothetical protein
MIDIACEQLGIGGLVANIDWAVYLQFLNTHCCRDRVRI